MRCKVDTLFYDVIVFIIEPHRSHGGLILWLDATLQSTTRSDFVLLLLNYLSSLLVLSHSESPNAMSLNLYRISLDLF